MILEIIISFLAVCLLAATIAVIVITYWYKDLEQNFTEQGKYIDQLEGDKQLLLSDKLDLVRENEKLYTDNANLAKLLAEKDESVSEFIKAVQEEPELAAEEEILQAPAENPMERLPDLPTNRFDAEPYNEFDPATEHYKLQQKCETEALTGLRFYYDGADKYYCAALGGAYGATIGDAWRVTLKCGTTFNIIRADFKHALPPEPDDFGDLCRNYDKQLCMNVIEFVADFGFMTQAVKDAGGYHELEVFGGKYGDGGNIVKLEYLGRRWEP